MKPSWWELICYSPSNFTQMIWVNVIPEFRIQMRNYLLKKKSMFVFFPMFIRSILLLCPSLLFGLLLILCLIYIPFGRNGLSCIFFNLSFSLGKCPTITHCSVVFLILQQAWKTSCRKQCICFCTLNFSDISQVVLILASFKCFSFQLQESFWKLGKLHGNWDNLKRLCLELEWHFTKSILSHFSPQFLSH